MQHEDFVHCQCCGDEVLESDLQDCDECGEECCVSCSEGGLCSDCAYNMDHEDDYGFDENE